MPLPHWLAGTVRGLHQFARHLWRCIAWLWRVLDKIHRWILRTLLLKIRAFLTGVGGFFCLMAFAWIVTPISDPLPVSGLIWFSLGGGILALVGHKYYSRFKAFERFMDWLERKGRQRQNQRKSLANTRESESNSDKVCAPALPAGRFKDRPLELIDLIPRFEGATAGEHHRNARGFIERLADDGAALFKDDPDRAARWKDGCMELREMITHLGRADRPDLAKALREFNQAFEHHTRRIHQMAYGADQSEDKQQVKQVLDWIAYTYRFSIYAILASYLDDKQVTGHTHYHLDMETRKWAEISHHMEQMQVPKKYQHATKRI